MTVFQADWLCPASSAPVAGGAIAVENGIITDVGSLPSSADVVRFPGCAIIPGFVNAHAHLELTILRGFLEDADFFKWIRAVTVLKQEHLSVADMRASARLGVVEALAAGVTCVGEVMDVGVSWQAMLEFGLQGVAYQEVFGPSDAQADDAFKGLVAKVEGMRSLETATQRLGVSPHAPFTVSVRAFRMVKDYARRQGLPVTVHIAESAEEDLFVRLGEGPFAERHRSRGFEVVAEECSPIAYLERCGVLDRDTLLIHAIRTDAATPDDAAKLYEQELRAFHRDADQAPLFDLVLLGVGPDGHIASLFPGMPASQETTRWVAGVPQANVAPFVPRVSLTLPALGSAHEMLFLASGHDKKDILTRVFADEDLPAAHAHAANGETVWLLDEAAAPHGN